MFERCCIALLLYSCIVKSRASRSSSDGGAEDSEQGSAVPFGHDTMRHVSEESLSRVNAFFGDPVDPEASFLYEVTRAGTLHVKIVREGGGKKMRKVRACRREKVSGGKDRKGQEKKGKEGGEGGREARVWGCVARHRHGHGHRHTHTHTHAKTHTQTQTHTQTHTDPPTHTHTHRHTQTHQHSSMNALLPVQRPWREYTAALRGHVLYLYSNKDRMDGPLGHRPTGGRFSVKSALVDIAYDYKKRKNVFRLQTFNGAVCLIQATGKDDMLAWIKAVQVGMFVWLSEMSDR